MLIEFSVKNFLSFKDLVSLSMVATNDNTLEENTFKFDEKLNLLKSTVIYGANASGKSNLTKAIGFVKRLMINSSKNTQINEKIDIDVFRLNKSTIKKPAFFEMIFFINKNKYRYGFEVDKNKIHNEWLFHSPNGKEAKLFTRNFQEYNISNNFKEGKKLIEVTRENSLFLSVVAQFNGEISTKIISSLKNLNILNASQGGDYGGFSINVLNEDKEFKTKIINLLKNVDLGIEDIIVEKTKAKAESIPPFFAEEFRDILTNSEMLSIKTIHKVYDNSGKETGNVEFDFYNSESEGTKKYFWLIGPILDTLKMGKTLIIDELQSNMHPLLTKSIVKLFNSDVTNKNNAQLIFVIHDTNLLNNKVFRRDQIWFTEKNNFGESILYSLSDVKHTRKDSTFSKNYLLGKYGGVPNINKNYENWELINYE
ncbi:MAG: ATP-binding protein [Candidatus Muirbacterium halophilum]|nr:ATP-binding protein [Candidatus Muirbacterium halophilum]